MAICEICGIESQIKDKSPIMNVERNICSNCVSSLKKCNGFEEISKLYLNNWDTISIDLKGALLQNSTFKAKRMQRINNANGYYEYKIIDIVNKNGLVDTAKLSLIINDYSMDGWKVVSAHSNELGKNALAVYGFGVNATAEQNIIILERFKKVGK